MLFLTFFIPQYLGYEEVKEARGVKVCSLAVAKLIKDKKNVRSYLINFTIYDERPVVVLRSWCAQHVKP